LARNVIKRFSALTAALLFSLGLAACSSFSNTVSDNWPTWAGGMPKDVPPRPGAPGYEEFIAHQQSRQATGTADTMPAGAAPPPVAAAPPPPASANAYAPAPAAVDRQGDQAVAQGGLY